MVWLDQRVDIANLAMVLVCTSAVATLRMPAGAAIVASGAAIVAFNWFFIPPRGALSVDLQQHALLLGGMLVVSWMLAAIVLSQRHAAERARLMARRAGQLRELNDALRDADDPGARARLLRDALAELLGEPVAVMLLDAPATPALDAATPATLLGTPSPEEASGLQHCARQSAAFGPGTGRYEELDRWYLPVRGRATAFGAAVMPAWDKPGESLAVRSHAQAICDQVGLALEREAAARTADSAREEAQMQSVRNAMLAAVSHDYRTPLATIMGAASSLLEQGERVDAPQRRRLAQAIVDEAARLARLADNTLQLARLDAPGLHLGIDWESAEEIVGAALTRARRHDTERRVRARLEPGLPLVRCDTLLMGQLLDNLVENALKYSEAPAPVEVLVRRQGDHVVFAVRDRGPGVPLAWRERIFEPYEQGEHASASGLQGKPRRGAGVGLAVCRAIARAHGGELRLRARAHGGSSFECWLPVQPAPEVAEPLAPAGQEAGE